MRIRMIKLAMVAVLGTLLGTEYALSCFRIDTLDCLWVCHQYSPDVCHANAVWVSGSGQGPVTTAPQQGQTGYAGTAHKFNGLQLHCTIHDRHRATDDDRMH